MTIFYTNLKPDKNPKPDYTKPEPDFQKGLKPEPDPNPIRQYPNPPEPDKLKPVASLSVTVCSSVTYNMSEN